MITVLVEKGSGHPCCEDSVLAGRVLSEETAELPLQNGFICVSDGVGGLPGGREASRFLTAALAEAPLPDDGTELKKLLLGINEQLIRKGAGTLYAKMAAALTGVMLTEGQCFLYHAGNTRAWVLQGSYLKQLTDDHTLRERLRQLGQYEKAARANPSELIGCFGGGDTRFASVLTVSQLPDFRTLILTSDGIHDHLDEERMEEILTGEGSDSEKCAALCREARQNGSDDDISAVIIRR